jgi:hypothetical protein
MDHGRVVSPRSPIDGKARLLVQLYPAEEVVSQLIALFVEVEELWKSGNAGPHIRLLPVPPSLAGKNFGS